MNFKSKGFTLVELLFTVLIVSVLTLIVILIVSPEKQARMQRDAQRQRDATTILNAINNHLDDGLKLPINVTGKAVEICKTHAISCKNLVDLSFLTRNEKYLISIPFDPTGSTQNGTGYTIQLLPNGKLAVLAPYTETGKTIRATN